jgi:hypothetical protein
VGRSVVTIEEAQRLRRAAAAGPLGQTI